MIDIFEFDNDVELKKLYISGNIPKINHNQTILKNANLIAYAAFYGAMKCFNFLAKNRENLTLCNNICYSYLIK